MLQNSSGDNNHPIDLIRIGSGTFSPIYMNTATPEVHKKCHSAHNCAILAKEYCHMKRFFNTYNFLLTRGRVEWLDIDTVLLSSEMGRMLAQFHMTARNDTRDIEVVFGKNITDTVPSRPEERREPRAWVIDFNQVKEFNFTEGQIPLLVDAFYANEAYFPRARLADSLYDVFSKAYLEECNKIGEVAGQLGHKFIIEPEAEQARKGAERMIPECD